MITTNMPTTQGQMHLVETRQLLDKGHVHVQVRHPFFFGYGRAYEHLSGKNERQTRTKKRAFFHRGSQRFAMCHVAWVRESASWLSRVDFLPIHYLGGNSGDVSFDGACTQTHISHTMLLACSLPAYRRMREDEGSIRLLFSRVSFAPEIPGCAFVLLKGLCH